MRKLKEQLEVGHRIWWSETLIVTVLVFSTLLAQTTQPSLAADPITLPGVHEGSLKSDVYKLLKKDFVNGLELSPTEIDDVVHKILWKTDVPISGHVLLNPPGPGAAHDEVALYEFGKQINESRSIDLDKVVELKKLYIEKGKGELAYQVMLLEALINTRLPNPIEENKKLLADFEKFRHEQMQSKLAEADKFLSEKDYRHASNRIIECFGMAKDGQSLLKFSQVYPEGVSRFDISSLKFRSGPNFSKGDDAYVTFLITSRSDIDRANKIVAEANPHLGEWPCWWTPVLNFLR
jgi:hypothetical protein